MIKIVTDSTLDLDHDFLKELDVTVVPLLVTVKGTTYRDGVDITNSEFMNIMAQSDELPKSSQPPIGQFLETFNALGADGSEVLSINLTDRMSGTYQSACAAANMSDAKVTVHNSSYISQALGFQVKEAVSLAKKGLKIDAIIERLEQVRKNTSLYIVVDKLENLAKGGRIGKGAAFIGSLLNIKPIASLENGEYTPVAKVRNYSQVIKFLAARFAEEVKGKTIKYVGISHADGLEHAHSLCEAVKDIISKDRINIFPTTSVISTHTGPGAIAFMYMAE